MNGQLRGKVIDRSGHGVAEATVVVVKAPGPVPDIAAVTRANGSFSFGEVPSGRYRLRALGQDGDKGEDDVTVPLEQAVIRLDGTQSIPE